MKEQNLKFLTISSFVISLLSCNPTRFEPIEAIYPNDSILYANNVKVRDAVNLGKWYYYVLNFDHPIIEGYNEKSDSFFSTLLPFSNVAYYLNFVDSNKIAMTFLLKREGLNLTYESNPFSGFGVIDGRIYIRKYGNSICIDSTFEIANSHYLFQIKKLKKEIKQKGINPNWIPWFKQAIKEHNLD